MENGGGTTNGESLASPPGGRTATRSGPMVNWNDGPGGLAGGTGVAVAAGGGGGGEEGIIRLNQPLKRRTGGKKAKVAINNTACNIL